MKKITRRSFLTACAAASAASALAACSSSSSTATSTATTSTATSTGSDAVAQDPVTIKVATWDLDSYQYMKDTADAFVLSNGGAVNVEWIDIASADYTTKLSVMLNGGSDLDLYFVKDADTSLDIAAKGQMLDLTDYIAASGMDLADFNGSAESFYMPGPDGTEILAGLPYRTDYYILYFNKDMFDAANEPYPSNDMTWDEFEAIAKRITTGEGSERKYGALYHTWNACVMNWTFQSGEHTFMDGDYAHMSWMYEIALRMQNDDETCMDYATLSAANIHYSSPFLTGQVGMMPMGSWFINTIISSINNGESDINWGIATIPHPEGVPAGYTIGSGAPTCINPASTKIDAAWSFLEYLSSEEAALMMSEAGALACRSSEATTAALGALDGMPEGAVEALVVKNLIRDRPIEDQAADVNTILGEEHQLIMLGELSIEEGLAEASERVQELLGM